MRSLYPIFIASLTLALPAFPQAILEHSAAAAGATIGTTAGKSLSNSMDKIFGNLEENTVHAAGVTKEDKKKQETALEPQSAQAGSEDSTTSDTDSKRVSRSRKGHAKVAARTQPAAAPLISIPAPEPPVKEPALADLLNVKTGAKEESLTASLGQPTSKVTIPDDGHLVEILRYTAGGQLLGVIRVDNGEVVNVLPVGQAR